ncbi:MAG TPA: MarR family transcriptional regulator [Cytophagaceae bacterium]|nr:MarR family transcriptional regulator [Cytophagaceae bacterium]
MDSTELASSLRVVVSSLHKGLRKRTSAMTTYSMTEMETIGHLFRNDFLLPTELANLTRITTQSMSQILTKMEQQKLIKKTPSREDKRKVCISLTASGRKLVDTTLYEKDEWLKNIIENNLTEKEKDILIKVLPVLNKLAEAK